MPLYSQIEKIFDGHHNAEKKDKEKGRRVYVFRKGFSLGDKSQKELLGGKGANLCEMARIGLNVPPGLTITTEACEQFQQCGGKLPAGLWEEVAEGLREVEKDYGAKFADPANPLLVSVRSGAAVSMPGMMDTVLNLGLNDKVVEGLAKIRGDRFAYDSYRRLLDMFADVVLGVGHEKFEKVIHELKEQRGRKFDVELTADDLKELCKRYKQVYKDNGIQFPDDPNEQLRAAIAAVFNSWNTPRAVKYRMINRVTGLKGTAVNVQSMVYGNLNDESCTGVCFTRNAGNGDKMLYGEFLINAQGEDVVAGIRTPLPIVEMGKEFPEAYADLLHNTQLLENHMRDMQDCEFTVQDKKLYMLQTRNGKRTGQAALKIALDLVDEGLVTQQQAIQMVEPRHLEQLLHPEFENTKAMAKFVIGEGLPASPGAAVGRVVFTAEDAEQWREQGEKVILVRLETSPEDVGGMHAAEGILTARGGMTSHAAVVARGWGKPCVCGCEALEVQEENKCAKLKNNVILVEGDWISLNGTTGEIFKGKQPLKRPGLSGRLATFMAWVDAARQLQVLANADTPEDAKVAVENGAQGIGLCRTEHMFFSSAKRISAVRRMIAAESLNVPKVKVAALQELQAFQREDFEGIFEAMDGFPVTIRLLDPPLHEFLPKAGPALDALCESLAAEYVETPDLITPHMLKGKIEQLHEANPMMGFRGCRLGIVHPDITHMQVSAIIEAAVNVQRKGVKVFPHIMIPLVGITQELDKQIAVAHNAAKEVFAKLGGEVKYHVGTMIEIPRGALMAGELAKSADFFSFGTNDLTQMTFGFSRDDAEAKFLPVYIKEGILPSDPFQEIDVEGVGQLVELAACRGRATKPDLGLGVCGEHGGDAKSIAFFHKLGLDYVSCSPLRVPVARLAAAQAALKTPVQKAKCHHDGFRD